MKTYSLEEFSKIIEAKEALDVWPKSKEPLIASEDEHGIVTLCDKDGNVRYVMSRLDYDDIVEWEAELAEKSNERK